MWVPDARWIVIELLEDNSVRITLKRAVFDTPEVIDSRLMEGSRVYLSLREIISEWYEHHFANPNYGKAFFISCLQGVAILKANNDSGFNRFVDMIRRSHPDTSLSIEEPLTRENYLAQLNLIE